MSFALLAPVLMTFFSLEHCSNIIYSVAIAFALMTFVLMTFVLITFVLITFVLITFIPMAF
jgi:hypothetical protein